MTEQAPIDTLEHEESVYEANRQALCDRAEGQYVIIKGDRIVGTYESEETAFRTGVREFGGAGFYIKKIARVEPVYYFPGPMFSTDNGK